MPQPNQTPEKHGDGVADGEDADINRDVLHMVEEEDDAEQEQDMVVSRDHVLCAQIDERDDMNPEDLLDIARVAGGNGMGVSRGRESDQHQDESGKEDQGLPQSMRQVP